MTGAHGSADIVGDDTLVLGHVAALLRTVTQPVAPSGAMAVIATSLTGIADALALESLRVAVDVPRFGRQVFSARRALLGDDPTGLAGPPGVFTDPPRRLATGTQQLVVDAVGVAMTRAAPAAAPGETHDESPVEAASNGNVAVGVDSPRAPETIEATLDGAVARALAYGWSFTLVALQFPDGPGASPERVAAALRPGDIVVSVGADELALILPAADDESTVAILHAAHERGALPPCVFGLAQCPGDGTTTAALLAHAARGLADARGARDHPISER